MATVIQAQPKPSFGAALGQGVGNQLLMELHKQEQQEKMKKFSAFVQAMQGSPDRNSAFNVLSGAMSSGIFQDPQDLNAGFHLLDMMHPLKDQTPHEVTFYDKAGKPQKRFVQASDLPKLSDPSYAESRFPGLSMENPGERKPYILPEGSPIGVDPSGFDYQLSKNPTFVGKYTEQNAPPGTVPEEAYKFGLEVASKRREQERLDLSQQREERLVGTAARQASAEERRATTAESQAKNQKADNLRQDLKSAEGALKTYYGRTLDSGLFGGFDDENKRKAYVQALEKSKDYIRNGKDYASAVSQAIKDVGVVRPDVPPESINPKPDASKEKSGFFSNFWKGLTGGKGKEAKNPADAQIKQAVEKAGQKYEPDKYEYKIEGNQILRKPKGK